MRLAVQAAVLNARPLGLTAFHVNSLACKAIATISVDRVDIKSQIAHGDLIRLEGEVIFTGRSSLAVQVPIYLSASGRGRHRHPSR